MEAESCRLSGIFMKKEKQLEKRRIGTYHSTNQNTYNENPTFIAET